MYTCMLNMHQKNRNTILNLKKIDFEKKLAANKAKS